MRIAYSVIFFLLFVSFDSKAQTAIKLENSEGNYYYSITKRTSKKLLVFLHGGVQNPYFQQSTDKIELNFLIENNQDFITKAIESGFDVIVPITNSEFDWIEDHSKSLVVLKSMIASEGHDYEQIFISGFSDGGTGSYRMFYSEPTFFHGLVVFNGFPQASNFNQKVDYSKVTDQKVIFCGTTNDKMIPYEFLMIEYCEQKKTNPNTYLYVTKGGHSFSHYEEKDFTEVFSIINGESNCKSMEVIHGYIKQDKVIRFYPFRKKVLRKYRFGEAIYLENKLQKKSYKKLISK